MPTDKRRAAARRRAWGRGPMILRFEPLEGRVLLSTTTAGPDVAAAAFDTLHNLDWGDRFHAKGMIGNDGAAAVTIPFHVDIYASPTPGISSGAVLIGEATIPAGLQPGQTAPFDQVVNLPGTPLAGLDRSGTIYVAIRVDPEGVVNAADAQNSNALGQGYDTSVVTITPHQSAALVGASLGVYPDHAAWGGSIQVTAQVRNDGAGDAPATRARVVLTPSGVSPGGSSDVTIGSINVPAVPANQTVAVSQSINLPTVPPTILSTSTQFTLSLVQDADFVTSALSPHAATQGLGFDMTQIAIPLTSNTAAVNGPKPDLSVVSVQAPTLPVTWGQTLQVTATLANQGKLDAGPFRVRFLLVGTNGSLNQAIFLGDATMTGLKAGFAQNVVQTLQLPTRLPAGMTVSGTTSGGIAVVIDPENTIDQLNKVSHVGYSGIVTLQLPASGQLVPAPGSGSTTTTSTAVKIFTPTPTVTQTHATTSTSAATSTGAATSTQTTTTTKKHAKAKAKPVHHTLKHDLKVFPRTVSHAFHDLIYGKKKK
jgi:hypothetical protein